MKKLLVFVMALLVFIFSFSNEVENINEIEGTNKSELILLETPVLEEINLTELALEQEINLLKGNILIINQKLEELNKDLLEKNIKIDKLENKLENLLLVINTLESKIKDNKSEITTSIYEKIYRYGVIFIAVIICGLLILVSMIVFQNSKNRKKMEEWSELIELKNREKNEIKNLQEQEKDELEELLKEM
ncbi:MAG: hypothetical protein ACRC6K_00425 [Fusobacteriaceae bacterium]